ncbi:IclR family transcriptional regulator [Paenarthrobacter sp. NPDC058040]|uniref:IclR family transcriptional regulator n=1 Tax=unclassified Paenarthrobacter TaxID=2634190 RepID=UPI0036D9A29E
MEIKPGRAGNSVHSVDRAISILQVLARVGAAAVTDIAAELSMHKSTVFRLLATLEARGLVEQTSNRGRYQLAFGIVRLAEGATTKRDLSVVGRPVSEDLAVAVGETVNLVINAGATVVSVDQVMGQASVTTVNWVGRPGPLHATAAGKVFLAHMNEEDLKPVLSEPLERYTPHTITDAFKLREQLEKVRENGYSYTLQEHEVGLSALAAPIRSLEGKVIASLAVSGPEFRINETTIPGLAEQIISAAARISELNGYPKRG